MTALTSALGMVPLVLGQGAGQEILQPLALVVLGGLFTSTLLTLLVIPALYALFGRYLMPSRSDPEQSDLDRSDRGHAVDPAAGPTTQSLIPEINRN